MNRHKRNLLLIISVASLLLILKNFYSVKIQSAVRAYIISENEYSKGVKDASLYLITFLQTDDSAYLASFKTAITIPMGDNIAGKELLSSGSDEMVTKSFLAGKNAPTDIREMIWFYKTFHSLVFAQKAIQLWGAAMPFVDRLNSIGLSVQQLKKQGQLTQEDKLRFITQITQLSGQSSKWDGSFSALAGDTSRKIKFIVQLINIIFIVLIMSTTFFFVNKIINSLNASENKLKTTITTLNNTNNELEKFSYAASHDLKEPLRMVTNFLSLIEKKYNDQLDDTGRKYIYFAVNGASRMKKLIDDLLDYSRTSNNKIEYETVNLNELISELKVNFQDVLTENGAGLFLEVMPQIQANRLQMQQLFQNLIANAVKYRSEATPQIYINSKSNATSWIFSVKDNGLGIEPEYFKTIFVIFQRLKANKETEGTGIGLAICKKIVERHGGEIWVESEPGKGSTFFFTISKKL